MTTVTKMRLSKETLSILKNFAAINSNILIKPGNVLRTISHGGNILAEAKIEEEFDTTIPIFDLNQFLGVVSMFVMPDLEFGDKYVDISNGKSSVRYFYSSASLLTVPKKDIKMPAITASFVLDKNDIDEMLKASSILHVSNLKIIGEDGAMRIIIDDPKNSTSNSFSVVIDENYNGPDYSGFVNVEDIKFYPGSYKVELSSTVVSKFTHESGNICYYIAINKG